jgi:hypothetical protein
MTTEHYSPEKIRAIFRSLEEDDGAEFFTHVAEGWLHSVDKLGMETFSSSKETVSGAR